MAYQPIENYGVIGDLHTVALVSMNGSIDWCCLPHFDSPSVFAALLDDARGGRFRIAPVLPDARPQQMYLPDTNVLITRCLHPDGVVELIDFMPVQAEEGPDETRRHRIVRCVNGVRGALPVRLECRPVLDYARVRPEVSLRDGGVLFRGAGMGLGLTGPAEFRIDEGGAVAEFTLRAGDRKFFVLEQAQPSEACCLAFSREEGEESFRETVEFWHRWLGHSAYRGRWREMVNRSALTLKLLTYAPTGAIVAAPTASLPEQIGGSRNWDYRYTWIRDASFTLYGLLRIGFTKEAEAFMRWIEARCREVPPGEGLQVMYGLDGRQKLEEEILPHLEGYRGSRPVRIGNDAYRQLQLDIYGELMDAVYLYNKHGEPIGYDLWANLERLLGWVMEHWEEPDEGIWEVRGGRQRFVFSRVMCWVALERAMRIARHRGLPAPYGRWREVRDRIYREVMARGWSEERRAFVQAYGSRHVDASLLLMPLVKFMGPTDPRMLATLERIQEELVTDSLVYRYDPNASAPDGIGEHEGTFSMCTFWLVECLTRAGRLAEARLVFEKMHTYANHLGLYAEEIGPAGEALGNFPQAFTHLALISAAFNLDRALDHRRDHD